LKKEVPWLKNPRLFTELLLAAFTGSKSVKHLRLKDYRPQSIYKIPITQKLKASFPVIDIHSHDYPKNDQEVADWVNTMDLCGVEKTVILSYATGAKFDAIVRKYSKYGNRFEIWCGFDYTGYDQPGYGPAAVRELERCYRMGARGVGELGDKGLGELYSLPVPGKGLHLDDPRLNPLLEKCAELRMPVSVHVAEPIWMYEKMDATNDGLMNGYSWRIDLTKPGILGFDQLLLSLENAVRQHPGTIFIACHFANLMHDLDRLGGLLDKYPNLYTDNSARYAETAPIPRFVKHFYEKYQDKILYGTDNGMEGNMYRVTFRILETTDEHFYEIEHYNYHWPLAGFGLPPPVLEKVYYENAKKF
jgi:predicted TIM-barrel fold metal-dependent hydrolase